MSSRLETRARLLEAFSELDASLAIWDSTVARSTAVALRMVAALNTQIGVAAATSPDYGPSMRAFQKSVNAITVAVKAGRKEDLRKSLEEARNALGRFLEP